MRSRWDFLHRSGNRFQGHCECGDHAWSIASQGFVTLVSPQDASLLASVPWAVEWHKGRAAYAVHTKTGKLHRVILAATPDLVVDHINGNGVDNRRHNLRLCRQTENARNNRLCKRNTSGLKGVSWHKATNSWRATIRVDYRQIHLGHFRDQMRAAAVYDAAAKKHFGAFAKINGVR